MKTKNHPRELSEAEAQSIVDSFDDHDGAEYRVVVGDTLAELRAAAAAQRDAEGRIEAAARAARREGASWGRSERSSASPARVPANDSSGSSTDAARQVWPGTRDHDFRKS